MILAVEMIEPDALDLLAKSGQVVHRDALPVETEALGAVVQEAKALIVRNRTLVDGDLITLMPQLEVVGRLGTGVDNLDVEALEERGVALVTGRGANAVSVAEWVIGYLFQVTKPFAEADRSVREGNWNRRLGGQELYGSTLGVIGMGDIGRRTARRAACLGMRVLGADPRLHPHHDLVQDGTLTAVSLDMLLAESDFITVHVPLLPATKGLIGRQELQRVKEGSHLIQTSRGGVVDEAALADALASGRLGGALVDVWEMEPPGPDHPLLKERRATLTPHVAGLTAQARRRVDLTVAQGVVEELKKRSRQVESARV